MQAKLLYSTVLFPLSSGAVLLMIVAVVMVMAMVVLRFRLRRYVAGVLGHDELVQEIWLIGGIRHEAYPDLLHSTDLSSDPLTHQILDTPRLLHAVGARDAEFDVHEVVLTTFDTLHVTYRDIRRTSIHVRKRFGRSIPHVIRHFFVDAYVCELEESGLSVADAGLDDHEGDDEAADGIEPGGVVEDVRAENHEEGDEGGKGVDAVMVRVGGEDGGFALFGDLQCCDDVSRAVSMQIVCSLTRSV